MPFDWSVLMRWDYVRFVGEGALLTIYVSTIAQIIGLLWGLILALLYSSSRLFLSIPAKAYIWFFRGTPLLVQLIFIYSGLPQWGIRLSEVTSTILALSLFGSAYMAEILRASIGAIDTSQIEAARIDGAHELEILRSVILPQALRISAPPLANEYISMLKNSSLASAISLSELLHRTTLLISDTYKALELLTMAAAFYLTMTALITLVQSALEFRLRRVIGS